MIRRYTVVQFVFAIVAVLWIGEVYVRGGAQAALIPCFALWALLLSLGMLNEGRQYARRLEFLRLLVLMPGIPLLLTVNGSAVPQWAWVANAVYIGASSGWLLLSKNQKLVEIKQEEKRESLG